MYHRFGEEAYPATNIRLDQFEAHLKELRDGGYAVLPVPEIIASLHAGRPLPERTVGITIDDAYSSVYSEAWPRLRSAGFPFTLFIATDAVDAGYDRIMTWQQIRELSGAGVSIGHHTASHLHMADMDPARNAAELAKATARFKTHLGESPSLFAYPYGEFSLAVRDVVVAAGFSAAFGQHSGVIHGGTEPFALPRFPLNEKYGNLNRFRLVASALPLPVSDVTPRDILLGYNNPPDFGFTVAPGIANLPALACYATGQGRATIERLGIKRFEVRFSGPFPPGRARVNCTMPGPGTRWRWFGIQFHVSPRS